MGRVAAFLGFGSSSSSSGTNTRTGGSSSKGWHSSAPLPGGREVHPAPAATDRFGRRVASPDPYVQPDQTHVVRNFGRPYRQDGGAR
ncbi:hypothetical protein [Streptomyces sp. NRRL WC-3742]|uniref:hypothetical protein n=1 Tax=Streptomyces sp. NRRL WC-3742 TaxID=1463934 RepID=UPI0004CB58F1|nr:hypothetical protein [Streptomyces sp. NRRL WC-3742]